MPKIKAFYEYLSNLSGREKLVLYAAAFFVSVTLLDRLIISPIHSKIKSLDSQIRESEAGIRKNLRILSQKDRIIAESSKYSPFLSNQGDDRDQITLALKEIESIANKSSVYLVDLKPSSAKETGSSRKYLINLECEAQMEQLIVFMYNLENSSRLLTIEKYQITPASRSSSVAKCSMAISKIAMP